MTSIAHLALFPGTLADGEGFWVFMLMAFAIWALLSLVAKAADGSRRHTISTERKRCRHCQVEHPGFATYCRHCGRRF